MPAMPPSTRARCTGLPRPARQPVTGAIYDAWASLSFERGPLGLPTSAELQEPLQITQNFQHGTLNYERLTGNVTEVVDGIVDGVAAAARQRPNGPARALLAGAPGGRLARYCHQRSSTRATPSSVLERGDLVGGARQRRGARCPSPRRGPPSSSIGDVVGHVAERHHLVVGRSPAVGRSLRYRWPCSMPSGTISTSPLLVE